MKKGSHVGTQTGDNLLGERWSLHWSTRWPKCGWHPQVDPTSWEKGSVCTGSKGVAGLGVGGKRCWSMGTGLAGKVWFDLVWRLWKATIEKGESCGHTNWAPPPMRKVEFALVHKVAQVWVAPPSGPRLLGERFSLHWFRRGGRAWGGWKKRTGIMQHAAAAACCSKLHAACCSMLQHAAACCSMLKHVEAC